MPKDQIKIQTVNCETGEIELKDATTEQLDYILADKAESQSKKELADAKAQAKAELLQRLGITEDEAKLLLA